MLRVFIAAIAAALLPLPATAAAAPTPTPLQMSSSVPVGPVVDLDGHGYFLARVTGASDEVLMTTDGTGSGTRVVSVPGAQLRDLTSYRGALYFLRGGAIWTSDGTAAGTHAVSAESHWSSLIMLASGLHATASVAGDPVLARLDPATQTWAEVARMPGRSVAQWQTSESGDVYAWVQTGILKGDLVAVQRDGTTFNLVSGFYIGATVASTGDDFFFAGTDEAHGTEPWVTDGTQDGTKMIKDLSPGSASSRLTFATAGGASYVSLQNLSQVARLTRSTVNVLGGRGSDIQVFGNDVYVTSSTSSMDAVVHRAAPTDDTLRPTTITLPNLTGRTMWPGVRRGVFFSRDATASAELWWSDGESAPVIVAQPRMTGSRGMLWTSVANFSAAGGLSYFTAFDASGQRLWRSDGTPSGTHPIVPAPGRTEFTLRYSAPAFDVVSGLSGTIAFPSRGEERCRRAITITVRREGKLLERFLVPGSWTGQICVFEQRLAKNKFRKRRGGYTARVTVGTGGKALSSKAVRW